MRSVRNSLGSLRHVPGVTSLWHTEKGTVVGFSDGGFVRVQGKTKEQLSDEVARTHRRLQVLYALMIDKEKA